MLRLGYPGANLTLKAKGIITNRSVKAITIINKGIDVVRELYRLNLLDLLEILKWNHKHNIRFFRINSDIAPHVTNPMFIKQHNDPYMLAYDLTEQSDLLKQIGQYAKTHDIRLTMHPDLFCVMNSRSEVFIRAHRDIYYHNLLMDLMELDMNSVFILHGGGVYGNKAESIKLWISNYESIKPDIRKRIVIENDEYSYNVFDMLYINSITDVPVVFDLFHHMCYIKHAKLVANTDELIRHHNDTINTDINKIMELVKLTWKHRQMKVHVSEQKKNAMIGTHSDMVSKLPDCLFGLNYDLWVMIEAKNKELAALKLINKYKLNFISTQ
jgi:UV DNA damage endonuclease